MFDNHAPPPFRLPSPPSSDILSNRTRVFKISVPGGLAGGQPPNNHPFLVLVAGKPGNKHQKMEISGEALPLPNPHRVCCVD
jgi:hypothetical protein